MIKKPPRNSAKLAFSEEGQIDLPVNQGIMGMPWENWDRLKKMTTRISQPNNFWDNAGWSSLAASLSLFISADASSDLKMEFKVAGSLLVVMGIAFLVVAKQIRSQLVFSKEAVIEEMEEIEKRYEKPEKR